MSANRFRGDAYSHGQTQTVTLTNVANSSGWTVTINGKSVTYTSIASGETNATAAAGLLAALTAPGVPSEFNDITWNVLSNVITATAQKLGNIFTLSSSTTGGQTITIATTQAATGANHPDDPTNWTLGRVPAMQLTTPTQSNPAAVAAGSLTLGTAYYWVVTATNANGETVKSNEKTVTPVAATTQSNTVAAAGGSLGAGPYYYVITTTSGNGFESVVSNEKSYTPAGGNNTATLAWSAVTGATGYNIYRTTSSGTYGASSLVTSVGAVTTYNDTGTALVAGQPPASALRTATISWAQVNGAIGYKVYRSTSSGTYSGSALATTISDGSTLTFNDTGAGLSAETPPGGSTALGDDVYITGTSTSILWGVDPGYYIVLNSLHIDSTYTGQIGLPDINGSIGGTNASGYYEYRPTHLKVAPLNAYIGENPIGGGSGSGMMRIDNGPNTVAWNVYMTGSPFTGQPALWIKGGSANTLVMQQGFVGAGMSNGGTDAYDFSGGIQTAYLTSQQTDVNLTLGSNGTLSSYSGLGGTINCSANLTTLTMASGFQGNFSLLGSATMGTANIEGGVYYPRTTGTHTTVNVYGGGSLSHTLDTRAFNINTLNLYDKCSFLDPSGSIKGSGGGNLAPITKGNIKNMTLDFGSNRSYTVA